MHSCENLFWWICEFNDQLYYHRSRHLDPGYGCGCGCVLSANSSILQECTCTYQHRSLPGYPELHILGVPPHCQTVRGRWQLAMSHLAQERPRRSEYSSSASILGIAFTSDLSEKAGHDRCICRLGHQSQVRTDIMAWIAAWDCAISFFSSIVTLLNEWRYRSEGLHRSWAHSTVVR